MVKIINKTEFTPSTKTTQPKSSSLTIEFKCDTPIIGNTIRRVAMEYIPTYAFCADTIKIEENTSIFDNDYMKLRLSQLPILNINNNISYLLPQYINMNHDDKNKVRHNRDTIEINAYINITNTTQTIMNVTTDNMDFYVNSNKIPNAYEKTGPILLIQLRPTEKFVCSMNGVLGIGDTNNIWSSVSNAYYEYDDEKKKILLTLESQGQYDEFEILIKVCNNIILKLGEIENNLPEMDNNKDEIFTEIEINNNNYTICGVINYYLQLHDNITFCGITKPDYSQKKIVFRIRGTNIIDSFKLALSQVNEYYSNFGKSIYEIGQKYIREELLEYIL